MKKKKERTNGLLGIDLFTSDCIFQANPSAKSGQIAAYFAELAQNYQEKGINKLVIFLDRNPTHRNKMQTIFAELTAKLTIKTEFHLMAPYSPQLNLVEYAIHQIRYKILHHANPEMNLTQFQDIIQDYCQKQKIFTQKQIVNILEHIESLVNNV